MPENRPLRVLLCHASRYQSTARALYDFLSATEWMDIWFIESNLKPSQNWDLEIRKAIETANVIVALFSKSSQEESTRYPDPNFVFSLLESELKKKPYILSLRLDDCFIPKVAQSGEVFDYFPKGRRKSSRVKILSKLEFYASKHGFSQIIRPRATQLEQGLQWTPLTWKQRIGDPFDATDAMEEETVERKPAKPPSLWKKRLSASANRLLYLSLVVLLLFVVLAVSFTINFINTGETVNDLAAPVISRVLTIAPLPTPTLGVGSTLVSPVDGMKLVYVPAGEFIMGSDDGAEDEKPARLVHLDAYWIDQFEVTNGMYKLCVDAGKCKPPNYRGANDWFRLELIPLVKPLIRNYDDPQYENYPISRITWDDANSYCAWAGRRLPTEAEWEKAARGIDGRTYPWGENVSCTYANVYAFPVDEACGYAPARVGSYENGVSPFGAYDMAGNVFEFVSNDYEYFFETDDNVLLGFSVIFRVRKGGSWISSGEVARSANRELWNSSFDNIDPNDPEFFDPNGENGFRCATSGEAPVNQSINPSAPTIEVVDPRISPIDDMSMVYVSSGEFLMGSDYFEEDQKPAHNVYLDAFWIDQYEVTNGMYAKCVEAKRCDVPIRYYSYEPIFNSNQEVVGFQLVDKSKFLEELVNNPDFLNQPVTGIFWENAQAYCRWAGRRLPTEAEWEKAARGVDGRTYPWGEHVDCTKANLFSCVGNFTHVGSFEEGMSPYNAYDMAGNAMEWVADWYDRMYYQTSPARNPLGTSSGSYRVFRGGGWGNEYLASRTTNRPGYIAQLPHEFIGFRCALSE